MLTYFAIFIRNNSFAITDMEKRRKIRERGSKVKEQVKQWRMKRENRDGQPTPNYPWRKNTAHSCYIRGSIWLVKFRWHRQSTQFPPCPSHFLKDSQHPPCACLGVGSLIKGFLSLGLKHWVYFKTEHGLFLNGCPIYTRNWPALEEDSYHS